MKPLEKEHFSDEEINRLAEWIEDLTIHQIAFLKTTYTEILNTQCRSIGQDYVH